MAKNANFVSHKKSKLKENGGPKLPLASDLVEGEIAINFGKDVETLSIKNESGDVVTFSSDNYYTEKKLGSGFTGENSAVTVTDTILWESGTGLNSVVLKGSSGTASGNYSVAEGRNTIANGYISHAEGQGTVASGQSSHAEGDSTSATSQSSHAEGYKAQSIGKYSHAEGNSTVASGESSHAEGYNTKAYGNDSHAEGSGTIARSYASHAEGYYAKANGESSHAEGFSTIARSYASHAEGYYAKANGLYSHAEGRETTANNESEHASGQFNLSSTASTTFGDSGNTLFSVGNGTADNARHNAFEIRQNGDIYITSGGTTSSPMIKLQDLVGSGFTSSSITDVIIENEEIVSAALNDLNNKIGSGFTSSSITDVIVENEEIVSAALNDLDDRKLDASAYTPSIELWESGTGLNSVVLKGSSGTASGDYSVAEGQNTTASGNRSHAEGEGTTANNQSEHASGQYNISNSATTTFGNSGNTLFSVGNGTSNSARRNAFEIRQNGDIYITSGGTDILLQDNLGGNIEIDQVIDSGTSASTHAVATKAVYEYVTSYTPSITVDQDFSNTASTNPISTKAVYSAITDNELVWTNAFVALSGTVSAHTANTEIHVTVADKARWDSSSDSLWVSGTGENAIVQKDGGNTASGDYSVAMGSGNTASGSYSVAEGRSTTASGSSSHAEGSSTTAKGSSSHAEGYYATTNSFASHAEGQGTTANGDSSHAEGSSTTAKGSSSHAEGSNTKANSFASHAEGQGTTANGSSSHAEGKSTIANNQSEHASGQFNSSNSASTEFGNSGNTLFSVGNGTAESARHNAFEIRQNGDIYITSGSSDIKLQDYIGSVETVTAITPSNSGSTDPIATKVIAENEKIVSNALTDLDERKLDKSDLSNYYTKSEISNALAEKSDSGHTHEASGITAMTGYQIASSSASVLTTDTLLEVIGKLEKRIALLEIALGGLSLVKISTADYENLNPKDPNTLYIFDD